jgi:hypothetical protein
MSINKALMIHFGDCYAKRRGCMSTLPCQAATTWLTARSLATLKLLLNFSVSQTRHSITAAAPVSLLSVTGALMRQNTGVDCKKKLASGVLQKLSLRTRRRKLAFVRKSHVTGWIMNTLFISSIFQTFLPRFSLQSDTYAPLLAISDLLSSPARGRQLTIQSNFVSGMLLPTPLTSQLRDR